MAAWLAPCGFGTCKFFNRNFEAGFSVWRYETVLRGDGLQKRARACLDDSRERAKRRLTLFASGRVYCGQLKRV
jgi:hypothetical protein